MFYIPNDTFVFPLGSRRWTICKSDLIFSFGRRFLLLEKMFWIWSGNESKETAGSLSKTETKIHCNSSSFQKRDQTFPSRMPHWSQCCTTETSMTSREDSSHCVENSHLISQQRQNEGQTDDLHSGSVSGRRISSASGRTTNGIQIDFCLTFTLKRLKMIQLVLKDSLLKDVYNVRRLNLKVLEVIYYWFVFKV